MALKFDDCRDCRFKRKPAICRECDYGEQFESREMAELSFRADEMFSRAGKSLVTEDNEPDHNPDDLVARIDADAEDEEEEDTRDDE